MINALKACKKYLSRNENDVFAARNYICLTLAEVGTRGAEDAQRLIATALGDYSSMHRRLRVEQLFEGDPQPHRHRWVNQLIRDCEKALRDQP